MSNTLNLGNGNWAVKKDSLLAYNDENGNFKPLPFTFSRASNATVVNKNGLIETVGQGEPRIDFKDNTKGALLLEPSRTNLILNSQNISGAGWGLSGWTLTNDFISPDGTNNAYSILRTTGVGVSTTLSLLANTTYTYSVYIKNVDATNIQLRVQNAAGNSSGTESNCIVFQVTDQTNTNNFTRITHTFNTGDAGSYGILLGYYSAGEYIVWGAQVEQGSYATSLINTSGSAVTRVVDNISLTLPDTSSFNSSNGFSVITKFDIGEAGTGTSSSFLFFSDDTSNTYIGFGSTNTLLRCRLNLNGTAYLNTQNNALRTQRNSLFVSCDASGWSQGANGVTNFTGTNDASVFNKLANITCSSSDIFGIIKISELLVYNTRLTNAELQQLTS